MFLLLFLFPIFAFFVFVLFSALFLLLYIQLSPYHFCTSLSTAANGWKPNCGK